MEKNKTGKYLKYAIGEIILVVIGILIALQINNWNQNQLNSQKEVKILNGIKEELHYLIERLELWVEYNKTGERLTREVLAFDKTSANKQKMDSLFSSMIFVNVFDKGGGLMETVVNDGRLELISNENIRNKLMRWPDMLEDIHTNDLSVRDIVWREVTPFLATFGVPEFSCEGYQIYCYQNKPISEGYLNLLENNQFKALMRIRHVGFQASANDHQTKADEAKTTLNMIEVYLNKVSD